MNLGVKETKDIVTLGKVVTVHLVQQICKDGFQWSDIGQMLQSPELAAAVQEAVDGFEKVPGEVSDIGLLDGLELGKHFYTCGMEVVAALKDCKAA